MKQESPGFRHGECQNKITGQTYLYIFKYEYHNGFWECIDNDVVVLNKVGDVMYPEGVVE